jgi:CheY-like chemotaxis protein
VNVPRRVLVVEDDVDLRTTLLEVLLCEGFEVDEAGDGEEGLRRIRARAPDAILLDLGMPRMDGRVFLAHLRADPDHGGIPVIVATGTPPAPSDALPVSSVLEKPVEIARLVRELARVLA